MNVRTNLLRGVAALVICLSNVSCSSSEDSPNPPLVPEPPVTDISACGTINIQDMSVFSASDGSYFDRVALGWNAPFVWQAALSEGSVGGYADLAIDSSNVLHASFYENTGSGGRLVHGWKNPGECWQSEVVDDQGAGVEVGTYTAIKLRGDEIHMAYVDRTSWSLKHAWKEGTGTWQTETVSGDVISSIASVGLALNSDETHIVFKGNDGLVHAWQGSAGWQTETIVEDMGQSAKIEASGNNLHVVFHTENTGGVSYATKSGSGDWNISVIDGTQVGLFLDLELINTTWDQYLAVSYYDWGNEQLKMAWKSTNSSVWEVEMVDDDGQPGWHTSITATRYPAPVVFHIAYQDIENFDLRHAWKASTASSWNTETLDSEGTTGAWTAIAVDSNQLVNIIYQDGNNLNHAFISDGLGYTISRRDTPGSGAWSTLDTVTGETSYSDTSVTPEVVYEYQISASLGESSSGAITDTGYADSATVVDSGDDVGQFSRIAVAGDGTVHIAYYDEDNNDLRHAWKSPSATDWSTEIVDGTDGDDVGEYLDLVLDTSGGLHVSYFSYTDRKLKHAWATVESSGAWNWTIQTVDDSGYVGLHTAIAAATDGSVHIVYKAGGTDLNVKHTRGTFNGATWVWNISVVDTQNDVGSFASVVVQQSGGGGSGDVHVTYYDQTDGVLKYAFGDWDLNSSSLTWTTEVVDNSADNLGEFTSVVIAGTRLHVSYHDTTNDVLKHAWRDLPSGSWNMATVEEGTALGFAGKYSNIAFSGNGQIHIVHYADSQARVDLTSGSWNTELGDYEWTTQTLDDAGQVGQYSDIAVGPDGALHVSYYDASNNSLKYVTVQP